MQKNLGYRLYDLYSPHFSELEVANCGCNGLHLGHVV